MERSVSQLLLSAVNYCYYCKMILKITDRKLQIQNIVWVNRLKSYCYCLRITTTKPTEVCGEITRRINSRNPCFFA
jgi:hypothetical protein